MFLKALSFMITLGAGPYITYFTHKQISNSTNNREGAKTGREHRLPRVLPRREMRGRKGCMVGLSEKLVREGARGQGGTVSIHGGNLRPKMTVKLSSAWKSASPSKYKARAKTQHPLSQSGRQFGQGHPPCWAWLLLGMKKPPWPD